MMKSKNNCKNIWRRVEKLLPSRRQTNKIYITVKYAEFHRRIKAKGWKFDHAEGSHYFYTRGGKLSPPVPFHGAKEMPEPLRRSIAKAMSI